VSEALTHHFLDVDIETDVANGRLLAGLAQHGEILSRTYADDRVSIHCRMPKRYLGQVSPLEARIKLRSTGQELARNGADSSNGHAQSSGNGHPHTSNHSNSNGHTMNGAPHNGAA
jgi:hypothetical protein